MVFGGWVGEEGGAGRFAGRMVLDCEGLFGWGLQGGVTRCIAGDCFRNRR